MLELLYGAGLRVSEITSAQLNDLNLIDRYVLVRGKGDKERIAPFGHRAAQALRQYLEKRRRHSPWLFANKQGQHLTRMRIWQIVHKHFQQIGRRVSPHMLRHRCATHLLEGGADFRTVQTILGKHLQLKLELEPKAQLEPGFIISQCRNPVCEKSKYLCELHLRLSVEASKRCRMRKRLAA